MITPRYLALLTLFNEHKRSTFKDFLRSKKIDFRNRVKILVGAP